MLTCFFCCYIVVYFVVGQVPKNSWIRTDSSIHVEKSSIVQLHYELSWHILDKLQNDNPTKALPKFDGHVKLRCLSEAFQS